MIAVESAAEAAWLVPLMTTFGGRVADVAPDGFDAYVRVFHPVGSGTWAEAAAAGGAVLHPSAQWDRIAPDTQGRPAHGTLGSQTAVLAEILAARTSTPDECFFAVWEGWGGLQAGPAAAMVSLPGRNYLLHSGAVREAVHSFDRFPDRQASLWWPADHAWTVVSEIDFDCTIVAGSRALADAVLGSVLEALEVMPETDLSSLGDTVNR